MKKGLVLMTAILTCQILLPKIPLQEAIRKGIAMNPGYRNRLLEEKISALKGKNARMGKRFTLDAGGTYLYKSEQMEVPLPGAAITAGARHNFDLRLSLRQPLFYGGILSNAARMEEVKAAMEKKQTRLSRIQIAAEIKSSYFNYFLLVNREKSLAVLIKRLRLHREKLEEYYREELVRRSDLLETRQKIREQELHRCDLNDRIEREKINFRSLCGLDIGDIAPGYTEKTTDFQESFSEFKSAHPVLESLEERLALLSLQKKIVKGEYLPRVAGLAELHYGKPGIDFFADRWTLYFQGGISLDLKLFDWNRKRRDSRVIDYAVQKVNHRREDFILEGEKHLRQLFHTAAAAREKLAVLESLIRTAREDIELKETLLEEQQIANIDYLAALTAGERYVSMRDEARARLELIKLRINQTVGKFPEEQ